MQAILTEFYIKLKKLLFLCLFLGISCKKDSLESVVPEINLQAVYSIGSGKAEIQGIINSANGIKEYGVVWSEKPVPTVTDSRKSLTSSYYGNIFPFSVSVSELELNKTYYFRAYFSHENTIYYSEEFSLTPQAITRWKALKSLQNANTKNTGNSGVGYGFDYFFIDRKKIGSEIMIRWNYIPSQDEWYQSGDEFAAVYSPLFFYQTYAGVTYYYRGGGYQVLKEGLLQRYQYLKAFTEIGPGGSGRIPNYPGADLPVTVLASVSAENSYLLENGRSNNLWKYSHFESKWSQISTFPQTCLGRFPGFTVKDRYFILAESNQKNTRTQNFYEYVATANIWIKKADFPGEDRTNGLVFTSGSKGYYGVGESKNEAKGFKDIWEYDPATDKWQKFTDYPGTGNTQLIAQPIRNKIYVGLGYQVKKTTIQTALYSDANDLWEFSPD